MVRRLTFLIALLVSLSAGTSSTRAASELSAVDQGAIRGVIESQLKAFQRDDGVGAFSHASPTIRRKFQTAESFMAMVRSGYPAVYRPRNVEFLEAVVEAGSPVQLMRFEGPDGAIMMAVYLMEQQPDGSWRINGVHLFRSGEVGS